MDIIYQFCQKNLDYIYFIYGLVFVLMGFAILVQIKTSEFKLGNIQVPFALFGITHGANEWLDMLAYVKGSNQVLDLARLLCLFISFLSLFQLATDIFYISDPKCLNWKGKFAKFLRWLILPFIVIFIVINTFFSADYWRVGNILSRYLLGFPSCLLIFLGIALYYRSDKRHITSLKLKRYLLIGAVTFFIYGILAGLVVPKGNFFLSYWLNTDSFFSVAHIPVQLIRTLLAVIMFWVTMSIIAIFNSEIRSELKKEYRTVFENTGTATTLIEEDTTISLINTEFERLSGYSKKEVEGKLSWTKFVIKEDLDRMLGQHSLRREEREAALRTYEFRFVTCSGNIRNILITIDLIPGTKKSVASLVDITHLKQTEEALRESEKHYRALFENMLDGYAYCKMLYDNAGRPVDFIYLEVNSMFEKLTGLKDVIGKKVTQVIPGIRETNQELIETYGRVAGTGTPERIEVYLKPLERWLFISVYSPTKGFFVAAFDDITQRKKAEEILKIKTERMATVAQIASETAHEIKNPLGVIKTGLYYLKMLIPEKNVSARETIQKMDSAVLRTTEFIDDLLNMSKPLDLKISTFNVNTIIKDSLKDLHKEVLENIDLTLEISNDLPDISGDYKRLKQVMVNIIKNAVIAMTLSKTKKMVIKSGLDEDCVVVSVTDTGKGIPKGDIEKIFEPFYTPTREGYGLGLPIVKRLVEMHSGEVSVTSKVNAETTFTVRLPIMLKKSSVE